MTLRYQGRANRSVCCHCAVVGPKIRLIAAPLSEMGTVCFDCSLLGHKKMVLLVPPLSEMGTSNGFVCFECSLLGPPIVVVAVTVP